MGGMVGERGSGVVLVLHTRLPSNIEASAGIIPKLVNILKKQMHRTFYVHHITFSDGNFEKPVKSAFPSKSSVFDVCGW